MTEMMSWAELMIAKFPPFKPDWPDDIKLRWFDDFLRLLQLLIDRTKN